LIRLNTSEQQKKLSTAVSINTTFTVGETKTFTVTWPENFTDVPEAYVGNIVSGTGFSELIITLANVTTTGATLYVYNPKNDPVAPNFTIKVMGFGGE
jgi:hypothetical protein